MPEIFRFNLKAGTVANYLSEIKRDLLPEQIARDFLAQWVMSFDSLQKKEDQRRSFRKDELDLNERYSWESLLYSNLVSSTIQTQIPFYFASLFHIGRQWRIAEFTLESLNDVLREENLIVSAQNLVKLTANTQNEKDLSIESSVALIKEMCQQGIKQQSRQLEIAREWWQDWRKEVKLYRNAVDEVQNYINKYGWRQGRRSFDREERSYHEKGGYQEIISSILQLSAHIIQGSSLRREMQQYGVQFKTESITQYPTYQENLVMLFALIFSNTYEGSYGDERLVRLIEEFMHEQVNEKREQLRIQQERLLAPEVEIALEILKQKCGERDPFMKYSAGKSAPTLELLEMIREHRLPNGHDSPWLHAWKQTLDSAPNRYEKLAKPRKEFETLLASSIRSADSTIKCHLTEKMSPTESWEDFLQGIFEKHWLEVIGIMAGKTNREAKSSASPWDSQTFHKFITSVVTNLNKLGYSLKVPSTNRLSSLLEQTSKTDYPYNINW